MGTATTTTIPQRDQPDRIAQRSSVMRLAGVAVASLVPAIFWSIVLELGSFWLGYPFATSTILAVGAAIALFLFAICAPLMLRKPDPAVAAEMEVSASKSRA